MESITIKKTHKEIWMKRFDDYEKSFKRIAKKDAIKSIDNARNRGDLFSDDGRSISGKYQVWGYFN